VAWGSSRAAAVTVEAASTATTPAINEREVMHVSFRGSMTVDENRGRKVDLRVR
jgi:hypothetical protein